MRRYVILSLVILAVTALLLISIIVESEALNPLPSLGHMRILGQDLQFGFKEKDVQEFLAWTAAIGGLLLLACHFIDKYPSITRRVCFVGLTVLGVLASCAAVLQYAVTRDRYFDAGDTFAYYLGPKYFDELDYDKQYLCTVVAHEELGGWVPEAVRDLKTNRIVQTSSFSAAQKRACKAGFSEGRWEAFKSDVSIFSSWIPRWFYKRVLLDHGYNGTPLWQAFAGWPARWIPVTHRNLVLLSIVNLLVVFSMLGAVIYTFGWKLGWTFALLFWTNVLDRYLLGGAYFRYDWIAALIIGICFLKQRRFEAAGVLIAFAAGIKIFPILFLAGMGFLTLHHFAVHRRFERDHLRFAAGAASGLLVFGIISICHGHGLSNWTGFLHQMSLNAGRLSIHRVGFIYNFFWPKEIFLGDPVVGYGIAAMKKPFLLFISVDVVRWALIAAFIVAVLRSSRRMDPVSATTLVGFALFFLLFSTVRYYFAAFAGLPLLWHQSVDRRHGAIFLSALLFANAAAYFVEHHTAYCFVYNTYYTALFTLYLIAALLYFNFRKAAPTARRLHALPASPSETPPTI